MNKQNGKYVLISFLALVVIFLNVFFYVQNKSGNAKIIEFVQVKGLDYYGDILDPVKLTHKNTEVCLPTGKATLVIGLNKKSLKEINELFSDLNIQKELLDIYLVKNNFTPIYFGSRTFYKIEQREWSAKYGLAETDDFLLLIDKKGLIKYFNNFRVDRKKIRLLLSQY